MEQVEQVIKKARAALEAGDGEGARALFLDALALEPANPEVWLGLGGTIQEPERAVLYYRRALQLDPTNPEGRKRLGQALAYLSPRAPEVQKPVPVPERKVEDKPPATSFPLAAELPSILYGDESSPVTIDSEEVFPSTGSILTSEDLPAVKGVGGMVTDPVWGEESQGLSLEWEALAPPSGSSSLPEAPLSKED